MSARNELRPRLFNGAPVAQVVRRTTVSLGPLHIVREEQRYDGGALRAMPMRRTRFAGWYPAAIATFLCVGAGGIALAATGVSPRGDYFVSIPVPDREAVPKPHKDSVKRHHTHRASGERVVRTFTDMDEMAQDNTAQITTTLSRAAAINTALRTGEMQEWRTGAGGEGGFVVAGPSNREGARECRDLSILTRAAGAADRVDQRRECRAGGAD